MAEVLYSPEAINDIQSLKNYISDNLDSPEAAFSTVEKIMKSIRVLADFPMSGTPLETVIKFETDYRFIVCGNYIVFYKSDNNTVKIIRVLYGKRNYLSILFNIDGEQSE